MSKESDFLFFRSRTDQYTGRLALVNQNIRNLLEIQIKIPDRVRTNPFVFYCNNKSDEDDLNEQIEDWLERETVPLFWELTLMLLSKSGQTSPTDQTVINSNNICFHIGEIVGLSHGYSIPPHPRRLGSINFSGFRDNEVDNILRSYQKVAEERLEKLRNINTHLKSLLRYRFGVHPGLGTINDAPKELRRARHTTSEDRIRDDVPVFDEFWLVTTLGVSTAMKVLDGLEAIKNASKSVGDEPETLDYFSNNNTNRISVVPKRG